MISVWVSPCKIQIHGSGKHSQEHLSVAQISEGSGDGGWRHRLIWVPGLSQRGSVVTSECFLREKAYNPVENLNRRACVKGVQFMKQD